MNEEKLTEPIPLGPFEIRGQLGQGGMGEVWRGVHVAQQVPVAIKFVSADGKNLSEFRRAFRREVSAVAGLSHPNIVVVYDYGEVPERTAELSSGRFEAGTPYLVMELAGGGSLDEQQEPLAWPVLKTILTTLLAALSHAHARGVIHRDMKPANVLVPARDDLRPGIKLTDFGIAHALDAQTSTLGTKHTKKSTETAVGSPFYMSPEQFEGLWRTYGPWTDIYSLGIIAFELASGVKPFTGKSFLQLAVAHTVAPLPRMVNRLPIPDGYERWVMRCLEKEPSDRFQSAADAAYALNLIHDDSMGAPPLEIGSFKGGEELLLNALSMEGFGRDDQLEETMVTDPTEFDDPIVNSAIVNSDDSAFVETIVSPLSDDPERTASSSLITSDFGDTATPPLEPVPCIVPPQPSTWRSEESEKLSMRLVGTGLGLYGLRHIPLVDRTSVTDSVWTALHDVRETGVPRLVLLRGPAGTGKTRIAERLCERAKEVGAANVLQASHSPRISLADGVSGMLARFFRVVGLGRDDMLVRLRELLRRQGATDEYDARALTELISSDAVADDTSNRIRFDSPVAKRTLIMRLLKRLGHDRPTIVWFDDIQWGLDALDLCIHAMTAQWLSPTPTLWLLTARDEALAELSTTVELLEEAMSFERSFEVTIPPLAAVDQSELVRRLLCLDGSLAKAVEERTAGNPLFAVQLVGDWVQRGVLAVGDTGFVLREGAEADLPDDIHRVWRARIDRLQQDFGDDAGGVLMALEIASALGHHIDEMEWRDACDAASVTAPDDLSERLVARRLAQANEEGWSFANAMLRESLERGARDHARWSTHNRSCAYALEPLYRNAKRGAAGRFGRHLLAATDYGAALTPLLEAAREASDAGDYRLAYSFLDDRGAALEQLGLGLDDGRLVAGWTERAQNLNLQFRFEEAYEYASKAEGLSRRLGDETALAEALATLTWSVRQRGDLKRAALLAREGQELFERCGDMAGVARCTRTRAVIARQQGDLLRAEELSLRAQTLYQRIGDRGGLASCMYGLGRIAQLTERRDEADGLIESARNLFESIGNRQEMASCVNALAESARFRGDYEQAEVGYREALRLHEAIGSGDALICRLNLGLLLLMRRHWQYAQNELDEVLKISQQRTANWLTAIVHTALLPCTAVAVDVAGWDRHMELATQLLEQTGVADPDIAFVAELATEVATNSGWLERAEQAAAIARTQRQLLG